MRVDCYCCGCMCFDGCKDESKDLVEHYEASDFHKDKKFEKYSHNFFPIESIPDKLENCGKYIP